MDESYDISQLSDEMLDQIIVAASTLDTRRGSNTEIDGLASVMILLYSPALIGLIVGTIMSPWRWLSVPLGALSIITGLLVAFMIAGNVIAPLWRRAVARFVGPKRYLNPELRQEALQERARREEL